MSLSVVQEPFVGCSPLLATSAVYNQTIHRFSHEERGCERHSSRDENSQEDQLYQLPLGEERRRALTSAIHDDSISSYYREDVPRVGFIVQRFDGNNGGNLLLVVIFPVSDPILSQCLFHVDWYPPTDGEVLWLSGDLHHGESSELSVE